MNPYEERLENRRQRLEERARKAGREAQAAFGAARDILAPIPLGQPILVGHHSERRHRRALERHDQKMRRAIEAQDRAGALAARARSVGLAGISSDDPGAVAKLRGKLKRLESHREAMKAANKAFKARGAAGLIEILGEKVATETARRMAVCQMDRPFPSYSLTNIGARIRSTKARIEQLEKAAEAPAPAPVEGDGARIEADRDDNRLRVYFDGKPPEQVRTDLKRYGFRWARSAGAWQRMLSGNAEALARMILSRHGYLGGSANTPGA